MAEKWLDGDSARTMTRKYNTATTEINSIRKEIRGINTFNEDSLKELSGELEDHISDYNKTKDKVEGMITSEVAGGFDYSPTTGILVNMEVSGKYLRLSTDADIVKPVKHVNVSVQGSRIVLAAIN